MILDLPRLVARHCDVPDATARNLQAAYIRTTSPTFLIFAPHQQHPLFVVKVEDRAALERAHTVAARLYQLLPNATAKPFGVFPLADAAAMSVQNGLPGLPWFRLGDHLRTTGDWIAFRDRCIVQLREFQQAVAAEPSWVVPAARFDEALDALATGSREWIEPLGDGVQRLIDESTRTLAALGPIRAQWQHGDFVVNNLLVDTHRLGIVDLHDFGKWHAPMLDSSALACSINFHARSHVPWHHVSIDLAASAAEPGAAAFSARERASFFVFYLLSAITDTLQLDSRAAIRLTYLDLLRDVAADPAAFERAFR
jgi:hypothetical protein